MKNMGVTEAKATFLAVIAEVEKKRQPVMLTRNGRKVAMLVPAIQDEDPLARFKFGGGRIVGDIEAPVMDPEDWEYD